MFSPDVHDHERRLLLRVCCNGRDFNYIGSLPARCGSARWDDYSKDLGPAKWGSGSSTLELMRPKRYRSDKPRIRSMIHAKAIRFSPQPNQERGL
jgi:hypothetical protein